MKNRAVGLLETAGFALALIAADSGLKAAQVSLIRMERNIGVNRLMSVTVWLEGEVAAVQSAVEAGKAAAEKNGKLVSSHVIPNLDIDVKKVFKK